MAADIQGDYYIMASYSSKLKVFLAISGMAWSNSEPNRYQSEQNLQKNISLVDIFPKISKKMSNLTSFYYYRGPLFSSHPVMIKEK